jgi:sec-independent protein translocase protein TatA
MLANLGGMHLLIILGIVLLLFGSTKLPALAKGLGQSISIFKKETEKGAAADATSTTATAAAAATAATDRAVASPTAAPAAASPSTSADPLR